MKHWPQFWSKLFFLEVMLLGRIQPMVLWEHTTGEDIILFLKDNIREYFTHPQHWMSKIFTVILIQLWLRSYTVNPKMASNWRVNVITAFGSNYWSHPFFADHTNIFPLHCYFVIILDFQYSTWVYYVLFRLQ